MIWEYKLIAATTIRSFEEILNKRASEGWQPVNLSATIIGYVCLVKRQKQ